MASVKKSDEYFDELMTIRVRLSLHIIVGKFCILHFATLEKD